MATITVGEVQAILTARDELSAVLRSVSAQSKETAVSAGSLAGAVEGLSGTIARFASGAVILAAVKSTLDYGLSIRNLALETGYGTERLQQLNVVSEELGASQGEVANAVYQLSRRIAGGDANAASAVEVLGLRVADLRKLSPDELMLSVAGATGHLQDSLQKADIVADLFGSRLGRKLIPILNDDLPNAMQHVAESGQVMSDQQIDQLARGEEAFDRWGRRVKAGIGTVLDFYGMLGEKGAYALTGDIKYIQSEIDAQTRLSESLKELTPLEAALAQASTIVRVVKGEEDKAQQELTLHQRAAIETLTALNAVTGDSLKNIGVTIEQYKAWQAEVRANIELTKAFGAAKVAEAEADNEGLKRAEAVAAATHALNRSVIEETIQSAVEKNAKLKAEDMRYADEKLKIAAESARSIRDLEDSTTQAILSRQASAMDQEIAMLQSAARVKLGTHEQLAQQLLAIQVQYASAHFNAERAALVNEERLEIEKATREAATEAEAAAKKLAIQADYQDRLKTLTITAMTALFAQEEALQKAHTERMRSLFGNPTGATTPGEGSANLTPAARAAQLAHEEAIRNISGAQAQAQGLGQSEEVQRLQQMLDEENAAFAREIENLNHGLTAAGQAATVAAGGLQSTAVSATGAGGTLDTMREASSRAAEALSGLHRSTMGGTLHGVSATELTRATYQSQGLMALFNNQSPAAIADNARRAAAAASGPSWRTSAIHVEPHFSGPMIGSDPTSMSMLYDMIEKSVMQALSRRESLPNH